MQVTTIGIDLVMGSSTARCVRLSPAAPYAYVTTEKFLEVFGLTSLRELPNIEALENAGLLTRSPSQRDLDGVLGLCEQPAGEADEQLAG